MPAAQLSVPTHALADLALEAAVAARVLRAARVPAELLQWLACPADAQPGPAADIQHLCDPQLAAALDEIVFPLSARPSKSPQRHARFAAQWLAVACRCCAEQSSRIQLAIGTRLLAASLLPLYRCLATDDLNEGLRQTQLRLSEMLGLLTLCQEVGPELVAMLGTYNARWDSPQLLLAKHFNLSLPRLAQLLGETTSGFDFSDGQFSPTASERLQRFEAAQSHSHTPAWAAPDTLWKLAGELASEKTELKLPRSWIDSPLPWNQIVDHWQRMLRLLSSRTLPAPASSGSDADTVDDTNTLATFPGNADLITASRSSVDSTLSISAAASKPQLTSAGNAPHSCIEFEPRTHPGSSLDQPAAADDGRKAIPPKFVISEIVTHDDPSFVNVIRRQIGKCRSEDRAISLVSLVVLPEDPNHRFAVYDNGLNLWQQKLVGWLAEHPQVAEPHAFLTADGELLLCILDLERNEATALLRHALVEVLTGQHFDDSRGNLLAEVDAPARYHAGIASTRSPGARFLPEQLIEPAIRCLSAARRHGKASIKSIEVY